MKTIEEFGDTIYHVDGSAIPRKPASDPKYIKHVVCEGARFHVLSWSTLGTHCSEPDCIINKAVKQKSTP